MAAGTAFTLEVAKLARRVVAVDFAEHMIENARKAAEAQGVRNVDFIVAYARQQDLFPSNSFDLAYTRRGPHIHTVVPTFVRPTGLLMGIHPEDTAAEEFAQHLTTAGLQIISCERFEDRFHFPALQDLAGYLSRQPGMPDLRQTEYKEELLMWADEFASQGGDYVVQRPYIVWVAKASG